MLSFSNPTILLEWSRTEKHLEIVNRYDRYLIVKIHTFFKKKPRFLLIRSGLTYIVLELVGCLGICDFPCFGSSLLYWGVWANVNDCIINLLVIFVVQNIWNIQDHSLNPYEYDLRPYIFSNLNSTFLVPFKIAPRLWSLFIYCQIKNCTVL